MLKKTTPKAESNAVTALLRNFHAPNTGKNTPNQLPTKPAETPVGTTPQEGVVTISQEILGGNVVMGDTFTVSAVNPDGTVTLTKQVPAGGAPPTV
jgi:hypothetical protein